LAQTLLIGEEGASLHFIEGCSAPKYNVTNLHAGCVELFVKEGARLRYSTIENWSRNMMNLNTKRVKVEKNGAVEWVSGSFGSHVSMLYPTSILHGENATCEFTGITFASKGQELDTGATVIFDAPNTSANISTRSISKSGGTLDTMSNFMVVCKALGDDADIEVEVVAVTDPNETQPTLLKKLAKDKGWQTFAVPDGVGGRFSIFSEVGLSLAACIGFDIESFLAGARAMDEACQTDDVWQNPAMLNAALKFLASEKYGRDIEVMMPYGDYMKSVSEWYIQLLAESLGKEADREGNEVCYGRTPVVAVGTTDMHAQTQQHQEGKRNKVVQFIRLEKWADDLVIPNEFPEVKKLADISGLTMGEALEVARQSNADALASNERFNALFSLPELNAYHLGELLYLLALSVAYEGELADVDAFNQPGVESYKRIMGPKLEALKAAKK